MKLFILRLARALGLFALARAVTRNRLKILCYHGIWTGPPPHFGDCLFMAAPTFAARMEWLSDKGYQVLTLDEGLRRLQEGHLGPRDVVITIDDAWYGTWLHMLPVLKGHAFPSTLYVPTAQVVSQEPLYNVLVHYLVSQARSPQAISAISRLLPTGTPTDGAAKLEDGLLAWILSHTDAFDRRECALASARAAGIDIGPMLENRAFGHMSADELAKAGEMGVDIQLHTHTHSMHGMNQERVRAEIETNRSWLAKMLGRPGSDFRHFCFPSGEHHESIRGVLRDCHIESATTTEPGFTSRKDDRLAMPRILDCQSISLEELEARLCGFWGFLTMLRGGNPVGR